MCHGKKWRKLNKSKRYPRQKKQIQLYNEINIQLIKPTTRHVERFGVCLPLSMGILSKLNHLNKIDH